MTGIIISLLVVPLFSALLVFMIPNSRKEIFRPIGIIFSLITLTQCFYLLFSDYGKTKFVILSNYKWIQSYGLEISLGISGMSTLLLLLTSLLVCVSLLSIGNEHAESKGFIGSLLALHFAINGVFISGDLISLFIFFEALLIPMYFLMGIWGGENRRYATIKFILYTVFGSVFIFIGTVYTAVISYGVNGSLAVDFDSLASLALTSSQSKTLFLLFTFGFLIKVPIFPLHTWLPDAHVEAPTAGSVILAAILLKMAGYGFMRFSLGLFPIASDYFTPLIYFLSVIAIIYTSLVALMQDDMKKLIAYSSVAHMGFVTIGIFSLTKQGLEGSIIQMLSHGLISAALFLCVGVVYDRHHSRMISSYGGLVDIMPKYAIIFMIFTLAALGLPGTSGFVGEFLVLVGVFQKNILVAVLASFGVILAAAYMLWLYRRVVFGKISLSGIKQIPDLNKPETYILASLAVLTIFFGVYPEPLLNTVDVSIDNLIDKYQTNINFHLSHKNN